MPFMDLTTLDPEDVRAIAVDCVAPSAALLVETLEAGSAGARQVAVDVRDAAQAIVDAL